MSYSFDKAGTYYKEKRLLELSVKALKIAVQLPESEYQIVKKTQISQNCSCDIEDTDRVYFITDDIAVTIESLQNSYYGKNTKRYSVYLKENWGKLLEDEPQEFGWYLISYIENTSCESTLNFGDDNITYNKNEDRIKYYNCDSRNDIEISYPFNKDDYFNYLMSTNLQQIPYEVLKEMLDFEYPEGFHGNYFDY